jgi:ATP-dependent DNA helicase RecG
LAREAAERLIELDPSVERWPVLRAELEYRYQRLMGGMILT